MVVVVVVVASILHATTKEYQNEYMPPPCELVPLGRSSFSLFFSIMSAATTRASRAASRVWCKDTYHRTSSATIWSAASGAVELSERFSSELWDSEDLDASPSFEIGHAAVGNDQYSCGTCVIHGTCGYTEERCHYPLHRMGSPSGPGIFFQVKLVPIQQMDDVTE